MVAHRVRRFAGDGGLRRRWLRPGAGPGAGRDGVGASRRLAERQPATSARSARTACPHFGALPNGWPTRSACRRAHCAPRSHASGRCSTTARCRPSATGYRLDVDVDAEMFCREIVEAPSATARRGRARSTRSSIGWARAGGVRGRGVGGGRGGAPHRAARLGDRGSGRGVDRGVAVARRRRTPRSARQGVSAPRSTARSLDGSPRGRRPPGRGTAGVPGLPEAAGRRDRHRAVGRGAHDRAADRDGLDFRADAHSTAHGARASPSA